MKKFENLAVLVEWLLKEKDELLAIVEEFGIRVEKMNGVICELEEAMNTDSDTIDKLKGKLRELEAKLAMDTNSF